MQGRRVCIVSSKRIPFARSGSTYLKCSNKQLMSAALGGLKQELGLDKLSIGEVILGAVSKHAADFSMARECTIDAGLGFDTPATDLQKACGTSLEAALIIAAKISSGMIDSGIAAGCDTNSDIPVEFKKSFSDTLSAINYSRSTGDKIKAISSLRPGDFVPKLPAIKEPRTGLSMGESCEAMAKRWNISREDQDKLAYDSHQNAAKAYKDGFFDDLITPFQGIKRDGILRADTGLEKLAKLKPCFDRSESGTLSAANSTPLTDGAACVFLCSEEYAKEFNLEVQAYLSFGQSAAVDFVSDEGLLMAPAYAVPKLLKRAGLSLQDFDFYEIHEAFAAQVLCTLKAWEDVEFCQTKLGLDRALGSIERSKLNINGGSLALGHPFGATGARIVGSLAKMIHQKGSGRGLISICTAGGMGVTAIIEK